MEVYKISCEMNGSCATEFVLNQLIFTGV